MEVSAPSIKAFRFPLFIYSPAAIKLQERSQVRKRGGGEHASQTRPVEAQISSLPSISSHPFHPSTAGKKSFLLLPALSETVEL